MRTSCCLFINLRSGRAVATRNEPGMGSSAVTWLYLHRAQDPNCCSQAAFQPSPTPCSCLLCWNELVLLHCVSSKGWCPALPALGPWLWGTAQLWARRRGGTETRQTLKGTAQPLLSLFQWPFLSHAGLLCLPCRPGNFWARNSQGFVPSLHSHIHAGRQAELG